MSFSTLRSTQLFILLGIVSISGCMNPGMYNSYPYGNNYGQPMYAPPQTINQGVIGGGVGGAGGGPGFLTIPESGPTYAPGESTFGSDLGAPTDGFDKTKPPFYDSSEDKVPTPRGFGDDLDGGVQYSPSQEFGQPRPSSIQPVSATSAPVEYGFDSENYTWLRGALRYDDSLKSWYINYSPAAQDRFRGNLILAVAQDQLNGFRSGEMIDVQGHVDEARPNSNGLPTYHIESIRRVSM